MKSNFTLALLALVVGACTTVKNENTESSLKDQLAAKWQIDQIAYSDGEFEELSECEKQTNWTFSQDNKLYIHTFSDTGDTPCTDVNPENSPIDYSLADNIVIYTVSEGGENGGPYTAKYKVDQVTSNTLRLTAIYEIDGISSGNPKYADAPFEGDIPVQYQWTYIFKK